MIFVTGGTGFLGRHLIPALCRAGYPLRVLTRHAASHPWLSHYPNLEIIEGDLTNPNQYAAALTGCRYVIHAGGMFRFWGQRESFFDINVQGTEYLLQAALAANVERFVHISTIAVIGEPDPDGVMDETFMPRPAEPYQASKLAGENLALRYFYEHQLPVVVLRPGAYYGPLGQYAFNRLFFKDPMRGIIMQIDGGRYINFPVYITDVVQGIVSALDQGRLGEVYNICGDWISHREAFDIICDEAGIWWPRLPIPGWLGLLTSRLLTTAGRMIGREPFWPLNLRSYVYNNWRVSNAKARRELDFVPTPFREGAQRTIAWYRAGEPDHLPELDC